METFRIKISWHGHTVGHHGLDVQLVEDAIEIPIARIALAHLCFFGNEPLQMLRRVIGVGIAEQIFRSLDELWIIREQPEWRVRWGRCHCVHVCVVSKSRMAVIVEDRDETYLAQHTVVGLLVARRHVRIGLRA